MAPSLYPIISFDTLPVWQGVRAQPGIADALAFRLVWDGRGFCRQESASEVIDRIVAAYAVDDYAHITPPPGASVWANRFGNMQADFVTTHAQRGGNILEIGAGSLSLARHLHKRLSPNSYVIVDPSVKDSDETIEIVQNYFPAAEMQDRLFRTILAFNTLEHVVDPEVFLVSIGSHMEIGGRALICVPDVSRQFATNDLNALLHEHISYFTPESFKRLAHRCGLRTTTCFPDEDILWTVVERDASAVEAVTVPPANIAAFGQIMTVNLAAKKADIESLVVSGKRVAFHGATNGLNNFLHLIGLSGRTDFTVFDGDASKTGRFLPGCPNPIVAADDPRYATADVMFVSAMTFYESICRSAIDRHGFTAERIRPLFE